VLFISKVQFCPFGLPSAVFGTDNIQTAKCKDFTDTLYYEAVCFVSQSA